MKTSKKLIETTARLIASLEGYSSKPYWDQSRWSWGYGTKVPEGVDINDIISQQSAYDELIKYLKIEVATFEKILPQFINNSFQIALLSRGYQYGSLFFTQIKSLTQSEIIEKYFKNVKYQTRRDRELRAVSQYETRNYSIKVVVILLFTSLLFSLYLIYKRW